MHDIPNRIADVLLEVEASLRAHGKWDQIKPDASDLRIVQSRFAWIRLNLSNGCNGYFCQE